MSEEDQEREDIGTFRANVDGKIRNLKKLRKQIERSDHFEVEQTSEDKLKIHKVEPDTEIKGTCSACGCP